MKHRIKTALLFVTFAAMAAISYAAGSGAANDALAVGAVRTSLTQAVAVAERHADGKAVRAELERSSQGRIYEVEVVSGSRVFDVRVDADKGTVVSSVEDRADHDDDREEKD